MYVMCSMHSYSNTHMTCTAGQVHLNFNYQRVKNMLLCVQTSLSQGPSQPTNSNTSKAPENTL